MFFPKEHRKRCKKAHFARFYTVFAFSTCQLRKKKEHIGSKGTNLLVQASYFTHPTDEKWEKDSRHSFCLGGYSCRSHS